MRMQVYSLFDRASSAFGGPVLAVNDALMRRSLSELLVEDQGRSNLSRYPDEFDVYLIGTFDTDTGALVAQAPQHLCRVAELLPRKEG